MSHQKIIAIAFLGLLVGDILMALIYHNHEINQHEPVKTQATYFYNLTPITASGTASVATGPINLIKL